MTFTLWLTGLPGSGKTSISTYVYGKIKNRGGIVELLDSDVVGQYFHKTLRATKREREINVRCLGFVASLLNKNGIIAIAATTSPDAGVRLRMRRLIGNFVEVYCRCSLRVAELRDTRGLYRMARAGLITHFTGIDAPYQEPGNPEIVVATDSKTVETCGAVILNWLYKNKYINFAYHDEGVLGEDK